MFDSAPVLKYKMIQNEKDLLMEGAKFCVLLFGTAALGSVLEASVLQQRKRTFAS